MENNNKLSPNAQKRPTIWLRIILGAIALILVAALLFYGLKKSPTSSFKVQPQPYKFSYSKLDSYDLLGQTPGQGIVFEKPVQITGPDGQKQFNTRLTSNMFFQYLYIKQSQPALAGQILVQSSAAQTSPAYLKFLSDDAKKANSTTAASFKVQLNNFLSMRLSGYKVNINPVKFLSTANLPNNAWIADFTAVPAHALNNKDNLQNMRGQAVLAIGKNAYYFLGVDTIDYNWQPNNAVWQKVFNSIKIDQ